MPQTKTAKDLPAGAVVETFWTSWVKGGVSLWTNSVGDTMTDGEIDHLLSTGWMLTRVPAGTPKEQVTMPRPHLTALMAVGTVIEEPDGTRYKKTIESRFDPFPWADNYLGSEWSDEGMAQKLDEGAQVVEEPTGHACRNCEGVDPISCPFDPKGQ